MEDFSEKKIPAPEGKQRGLRYDLHKTQGPTAFRSGRIVTPNNQMPRGASFVISKIKYQPSTVRTTPFKHSEAVLGSRSLDLLGHSQRMLRWCAIYFYAACARRAGAAAAFYSPSFAVGVVRGAGELGPLADAHAHHSLVPALDHIALADVVAEGHLSCMNKKTERTKELSLLTRKRFSVWRWGGWVRERQTTRGIGFILPKIMWIRFESFSPDPGNTRQTTTMCELKTIRTCGCQISMRRSVQKDGNLESSLGS